MTQSVQVPLDCLRRNHERVVIISMHVGKAFVCGVTMVARQSGIMSLYAR